MRGGERTIRYLMARRETIAYDMTTLLFFGVNCPLAELGYNPDKIRRLQVNLALLVSSRDKYPIMHFVYEGSRHSASTVKNLLARLSNSTIEPGTLIWDRGNISGKHVELVEKSGWKLISGVPKTLKAAKEIIAENGNSYRTGITRPKQSSRSYLC